MTWMRKVTGARWSRPVWGVLTLVTGALVAVSFPLSSRSLRNAESEAQTKAVDYTNAVLVSALEPREVQGAIPDADYRKLIITVQRRILSDPAVVRVRIWRPDGTLIFSSDQRDGIGHAVGVGNPQIGAAVQGKIQGLVTEARVAPKTGLAGSDERLYETFVPLRLGGAVHVGAVAQIDQRYLVITDEAHLWRPAEWAFGGACVMFLLLFWASLMTKPARPRVTVSGWGGVAAQVGQGGAVDERIRQLEERLGTSERELEETLRAKETLERQLSEAGAATAAPSEAGRLVEELERSEEERERVAGEVERLTSALAAKEADLALAQAGVASGAMASAKADEAVRGAEERAGLAESRAKEAEQRANEAEIRARGSEARAKEAEAARAAFEATVSRTKEAGEESAAADLKRAKQETEKAVLQAAEVEAQLTEERSKLGPLEASAKAAEERAAALEARVRELEDERRRGAEEVARAQERLGNTQLELTRATKRARELEQRLREAEGAAAAVPGERGLGPEPEPAAASPLARLRRGAQRAARAPAEEPAQGAQEPAQGTEEPAPVDEAGLSLRERLARAAAARHRAPGTGESDS